MKISKAKPLAQKPRASSPSSTYLRCFPVVPVARHLDLAIDEARGSRPCVITCPACRWRYGAIVRLKRQRWRCLACGAGGDALALVAYALGRAPYCRLDRRAQRMVRNTFASIADRLAARVEVLRKRPRSGEQEVA